jgi:RsiW-degrading membrane proteinase PrsW (M82 family)
MANMAAEDDGQQPFIRHTPAAAPALALVDPWSTLSCISKAGVVLMMGLCLLILVMAPIAGIYTPLLMVPTYLLFTYWRKYHTHVSLDLITRTYLRTAFPGAITAMIVELLFLLLFFTLCFTDQGPGWLQEMQDAKDESRDPVISIKPTFGFYSFIFCMAFVAAGGTEETLKYYMVRDIKQRDPTFNSSRGFLMLGVASALGFSTIENLGYVTSGAMTTPFTVQGFADVFGLVAERVLIATPFHCMTGFLIGIGLVRRDVLNHQIAWIHILAAPVFFHGLFDFALFLIYWWTMEANWPTWSVTLLSTFISLLIMFVFALYIIRQYRQIGGVDGYGAVQGDDHVDMEMGQAGGHVLGPGHPLADNPNSPIEPRQVDVQRQLRLQHPDPQHPLAYEVQHALRFESQPNPQQPNQQPQQRLQPIPGAEHPL